MGKAEIVSEIGDGQYNVVLRYERSHYDQTISALEAKIIEYNDLLSDYRASHPDPTEEEQITIDQYALYVTSYEKRLSVLQSKNVSDAEMEAWCADLTTGLAAGLAVGTMETPDEGSTSVIIRPGYDGTHIYEAARDGQLQPALNGLPFNTAFNWMLLPAYQKWKPYHRTGQITAIDYASDICDVAIDPAESIAQGLDINQSSTLSNVPIEYMQCNSLAFDTGDEVIVEFQNFDITDPRVIGFKHHPKACGEYLVFIVWDGGADVFAGGLDAAVRCFVWDVENDGMVSIDGVTFPCSYYDETFQAWLALRTKISNNLFESREFGIYPHNFIWQHKKWPERFSATEDCVSYSFSEADIRAMQDAGVFSFPVATEYLAGHPWNFILVLGDSFGRSFQYPYIPRSFVLQTYNGMPTNPCFISNYISERFPVGSMPYYVERSTSSSPLADFAEIRRREEFDTGSIKWVKGVQNEGKSSVLRIGGSLTDNTICQFYFRQYRITDKMKSLVASSPTDIRGERQTEIHASCDWLPRETAGYDWTTLPRNTAFEAAIQDVLDDVYIHTERYVDSALVHNILITITLYKILLAGGGAPLTPENVAYWEEQLAYWEAQLEGLETELGVPDGDVMSFLAGAVFIVK